MKFTTATIITLFLIVLFGTAGALFFVVWLVGKVLSNKLAPVFSLLGGDEDDAIDTTAEELASGTKAS